MFKKGDLVQLESEFDWYRHPPRGTMGVVMWTEQATATAYGPKVEQHLKIHWAHHGYTQDNTYLNNAIKLVAKGKINE